jgi:hypothetical protein
MHYKPQVDEFSKPKSIPWHRFRRAKDACSVDVLADRIFKQLNGGD